MQSSGPIFFVFYSFGTGYSRLRPIAFMNVEPANPPTNPFPLSAPTYSAETTVEQQLELQEMLRRLYPVV